jgi:formylglycine-generating enzyme required for sulfatase activity
MRDRLLGEVVELKVKANERHTFEFLNTEQGWWNRQLAKLVSDLEALQDPKTGLMNAVLAESFGWGMAKRYAFAKSIGERSIDGPDSQRLWSDAIAAIRKSPRYRGLVIVPQIGLLPIGMDPHSELWEFAHLQTGDPAMRGADGKLLMTEDSGLVFVLIPGGKFWMGSQSEDPEGANFVQNIDMNALDSESPVHEVELSPYFISKYEMTQGQWQRVAATNPSEYVPLTYFESWNREGHGWSSLLPVERVSWWSCVDLLQRIDLCLPTEAQWEFATRAGTASAYWSGNDLAALTGVANLSDAFAKANGTPFPIMFEQEHDDGNTVTARIGSFRANPYGLHDVHGNVYEWCLDGYDQTFYESEEGSGLDPVRGWSRDLPRILRGGCFQHGATYARSAKRTQLPPDFMSAILGLRPSRPLRLPSSPIFPSK